VQEAAILSSIVTYGRIIHNVTNSTGATLNGPALPTANGPVIFNFNAVGASYYLNSSSNSSTVITIDQGLTYLSVQSSKNPGGEIRGQLLPTTGIRRKVIPTSVTNIYGSSVGNLATLRHINQQAFKNNPGAYIRCTPESIGFNQSQYQAVFNFRTRISKQNQDGIRGFDIYLNIRAQGQPYLFEMLNSVNNTWTTLGTFQLISWVPIFVPYYNADASNYVNPRGYFRMRVTSVGTRVLLIDSMTLQVYHARSVSSQILRQFTKYLQHLPSH